MFKIEEKKFDLNTHDIELILVRLEFFFKVVFSYFKSHHLVQNCQFSGQNYLQNYDIRKSRPSYDTMKFLTN